MVPPIPLENPPMRTRSLALAAPALALAPLAAANHIDFIQDDSDPSNGVTDANFSLTSTSGTPVVDTQVGEPADILGGTRTVTLVRDGGFGGNISATKAAGSTVIDVQNSSVSAGTITLDYDGFENLDFANTWSRIDVAFPSISTSVGDSEFDAFLTVESSAGTGTASSGRIEASVTGGSTTLQFAFDDAAFADVDFTDVDRVTFTVDTAIIGSDFQIGSITREGPPLIPEPATAGLLALGGAALLRRRRA